MLVIGARLGPDPVSRMAADDERKKEAMIIALVTVLLPLVLVMLYLRRTINPEAAIAAEALSDD